MIITGMTLAHLVGFVSIDQAHKLCLSVICQADGGLVEAGEQRRGRTRIEDADEARIAAGEAAEAEEQRKLRAGLEDAYASERAAWDFLPR